MASCSPPEQKDYLTGPTTSKWSSLDSFLKDTNRDLPIQDSERFVSFHLSDLYPEWQDRAHCAGTGHDMYFGNEKEQPTMSIKQVRNAAKLCDVCPVYEECLRHALTVREEYGVWAGTSGRTRRRLFAMLDKGVYTIDELVEVTLNGRTGVADTIPLWPSEDTGADRLGDEAGRRIAL